MNEQIITKILEVSGDILKSVGSMAPALLAEVVNYFILLSVISLVKNLFFFLLLGAVYRFLKFQIMALSAEIDTEKDSDTKRQIKWTQGWFKLTQLIITLVGSVYLLQNSFDHVEKIGKALFAPKIFAVEMASSFIKSKDKQKSCTQNCEGE